MTDDRPLPKSSVPSDDDARTNATKPIAEEYAAGLREIFQKLRKLLN